MTRKINLILILCVLVSFAFAQQKERPKIGLTLSGGGAKGLAHIGLLEAIDSAGLDVEYVSGTSMGAIIGGLYAVGYSGKEIEKMTRNIDWDKIFTNRAPYDMLILPEKNNYGKYLEIPLIDGKLSFRRGALESNELWLTLDELFFPYLTIHNFDHFKRPFRSVATNIETGDAVISKSGDIVKALRASMAIPIAFTSVKIDSLTLIDGGIAMNFPVSVVKDMGANFVIGSAVSGALRESKEITNPLQMVMQLALYKESKDFQKQKELANIFVDYPLQDYNTSSFSSADAIIDLGIKKGREIYPELKRLKDSLDKRYGSIVLPAKKEKESLIQENKQKKLFVNKFITKGISPRESDFYLRTLGFKNNHSYSAKTFSKRIRTVFGSGNFRKINYEVLPANKNDSITVLLDFEKEPQNVIRTGLNYNTDLGIALKLGFSMFSPTNPFSKTSVGIAIGENPQFKVQNLFFFRRNKTWYVESTAKGEYTNITVFDNKLDKIGLYNQQHFGAEIKVNNLITSNLSVGGGTRFEFMRYGPQLKVFPRAKGRISFFTSFVDFHFNSLDRPSFSNSGDVVDVEAGLNYNQHPNYTYSDGVSGDVNNFSAFSKRPYFTLKFNAAHYFPVHRHSFFIKIYSGMHFGNKQPLLNDFLIGGNNPILRNQILFPGFRANSIYSSSAIAPQVGFQYNFSKKFLVSAAASYLEFDFIKSNISLLPNGSKTSALGLGLTGAYQSFIGPLAASVMYNDINHKFSPAFNIGYSLNF